MNKLTKIFRGQTVEIGLDNKIMGVHAQDIVDSASADGFPTKWVLGESLEIGQDRVRMPHVASDAIVYTASVLGLTAFCVFSWVGWVK